MMRLLFTWITVTLFAVLPAQNSYQLIKDISYLGEKETDTYRTERCKLDIYYPENVKDYPTIVWYHGGGLEGGEKHIPEVFKERGYAVVTVNYRLSPRATNPAYIEDAAEALAWAMKNISNYGGSKEKIYVSGHSAGGYLALVLALDKSYLNKHGVDADQIKAWMPISGQTATHYTIRKERGLPSGIPLVDKYAPLNQVRKDTPPILLISGDRDLELTSRYEENVYLYSALKGTGNDAVSLYELQGFDHGTVLEPACYLILDYIRKAER